jgi:hypothetical protein
MLRLKLLFLGCFFMLSEYLMYEFLHTFRTSRKLKTSKTSALLLPSALLVLVGPGVTNYSQEMNRCRTHPKPLITCSVIPSSFR